MLGYGLRNFCVAMTNLAVPKAADGIDVFVSFVVPEQGTAATHNANEIGLSGLGKGMKQGFGHGDDASSPNLEPL